MYSAVGSETYISAVSIILQMIAKNYINTRRYIFELEQYYRGFLDSINLES